MNTETMLPIKGIVTTTILCGKTGRILQQDTINNLVVNVGAEMLLDLITGTTANNSITQIGFGTGSAATAATDTALTGQYLRASGAVTTPTAKQRKITSTLGTSEFNGNTIQEMGLFGPAAGGSKMFSRVLRPGGIVKTSAIAVQVDWTLIYP